MYVTVQVYLPVEHIDSPFQCTMVARCAKCAVLTFPTDNDGKNAQEVHPKLRPPVDPVELEIDQRTGMAVSQIANAPSL